MTSWNNKPARDWRAADGTHDYTSVYRSLLLDARIRPLVKGTRRATLAEAVSAMGLAATTDLRGQEILPEALGIVGKAKDLAPYAALLRDWQRRGAHRLDRDQDGTYDDAGAVALMDAWWDPLIHAMFDPQLDGLYDTVGVGFHDAPGASGSAFQGSYYGTVKKALRQARGRKVAGKYKVLRCGGGRRKDCYTVVQASLREAVATLTTRFGSGDPAAWTVDPTAEVIRFSLGGLATAAPIPWQNRPTFQQVVQIGD
jgi:hypothetical protein